MTNFRHRSRATLKNQGASQSSLLDPGGYLDRRLRRNSSHNGSYVPRFAALDLGTNNCRLLICAPRKDGFRAVDSYSEIVRLGEGLGATGILSEQAIKRTIKALRVCAEKMAKRRVHAYQCVATQACRIARNGEAFLNRVKSETGLDFDIITPGQEARLAVEGCADLIEAPSDRILVFDIGGGSTELSWICVKLDENGMPLISKRRHFTPDILGWASLPIGVVTMSEKFGGTNVTPQTYEGMVRFAEGQVKACQQDYGIKEKFEAEGGYLLGTSGTVTSLASVHLNLSRYSRRHVDGVWLSSTQMLTVAQKLRDMRYEDRIKLPTIGRDRADLVVPGSAILEGIMRVWPSDRIRVADRGLREGILRNLIEEHHKKRRSKRNYPNR